MSGVYMDEVLYCDTCKRKTSHYTEWESEEPNVVIATCNEHGVYPNGHLMSGASIVVDLEV